MTGNLDIGDVYHLKNIFIIANTELLPLDIFNSPHILSPTLQQFISVSFKQLPFLEIKVHICGDQKRFAIFDNVSPKKFFLVNKMEALIFVPSAFQ